MHPIKKEAKRCENSEKSDLVSAMRIEKSQSQSYLNLIRNELVIDLFGISTMLSFENKKIRIFF